MYSLFIQFGHIRDWSDASDGHGIPYLDDQFHSFDSYNDELVEYVVVNESAIQPIEKSVSVFQASNAHERGTWTPRHQLFAA